MPAVPRQRYGPSYGALCFSSAAGAKVAALKAVPAWSAASSPLGAAQLLATSPALASMRNPTPAWLTITRAPSAPRRLRLRRRLLLLASRSSPEGARSGPRSLRDSTEAGLRPLPLRGGALEPARAERGVISEEQRRVVLSADGAEGGGKNQSRVQREGLQWRQSRESAVA